MKLSSIIKFECLYNAKHIYTHLFFFLLIFQGIWYNMGISDDIPNKNMMINAPAIAYGNLALMGIILFAVTAIITAGSLARDLESGSAHILYPAVVEEKKYFFGKYLGTVIVNFMVVLGYPIGILLFPLLGIGLPEQYGPVPIGQLLHGIFLLTVPNLIFLVTLSIFMVVMFRRAAAAYLGVLLIFIFFLVSVSLRDKTAYPLAIELLDPFGYCCVNHLTDKMDTLQFNSAYLPLSQTLLLNRLVWIAVSIVLFVASVFKFNFKTFIAHPGKAVKQEKVIAKPVLDIGPQVFPSMNYGIWSCLIKSVKFALVNVKSILGSPGFLAMLITLLLMFLGYDFLWTSTNYLTTSHLPLTSIMTIIRVPMMLVIGVMILILSGEILFKDRASSLWPVVDAMPTPSWVYIFSRWLTMGGLAFIIASLMFAAGVFSQWVMGFQDIEWGLYIRDLYGPRFGWLTSLQLISLAFFFGAVFNDRLKGHIVSIAVFLFIVMSVDHQLIERQHLAFSIVPASLGPEMINYSEMNGYGVLDAGLFFYTGAWMSLSALFFVVTLLLWNQGVNRSFKERLQVLKRTVRMPFGKVLASTAIICFILLGGFQYGIHDNLICKAGYQTKAQKKVAATAYEKKYAKYREVVQPKITNLDLTLDLFPSKRQAAYTAKLALKNESGQPIDTLHLDWDKKLVVEKISSNNYFLEKFEDDAGLRHTIFRLTPSLEAGESLTLNLVANLAYKGFHQSEFQGDLTYNGTVLGTDFLPIFGYDRSRELTNNKKRLQQGLAPLDSRMDTMDNAFSRRNRFESVQSDSLTWNMVISTDGDQIVIGPGEVNTWQEEGRNYAEYRSERPGAMDFKIISARLATQEFDCQETPCRLSYEPRHTYNLSVFKDAVQKAVPWLAERLGPYPYSVVRIVEKPFYDSEFITFANVTAISEARGWTADIKNDEEGQYIYLTIARELARQWIFASLKVADVQGAELLTQSLAQYYAFRFLEGIMGRGHIGQWLDKAYKDYEKERADEGIEEKPLLYVDEAAYLSRDKGGLALYALAQRIDAEKFDVWLAEWIARAGQKEGFFTSADFYKELKNFTPAIHHPFIRDWFERRIQYRLSLDNAQIKDEKLALTISAAKMESGGEKGMMEKSFSALLEVGITDESGNVKGIRQIVIRPGQNSYDLDCWLSSASVVLDPNYWYLIEARKKCSKKL